MLFLFYIFFLLHLQGGCAYQVPGGVRAKLVYLTSMKCLYLKKKRTFAYKVEKFDSINRNNFITQDSIKIVNECIVHLGKVTFISRNEYN